MPEREKTKLLKVPGGIIKIPEEKFKEFEEEIKELENELYSQPESFVQVERNTILNEEILKDIQDEYKKILVETEVDSLERLVRTGELFPIARAIHKLAITITSLRLLKSENKEKLLDLVLLPYEAVLDSLECRKISENVKNSRNLKEKIETWQCTFVSESKMKEFNGYKIPNISKQHTFQVNLRASWWKQKNYERLTASALITKGNLVNPIVCKNPIALLNGLAVGVAWNDELDAIKYAYKKKYIVYPRYEELVPKVWEKFIKDAEAEGLIKSGWSEKVLPITEEKFEDVLEKLKDDLEQIIYDEIDVIKEKYEII